MSYETLAPSFHLEEDLNNCSWIPCNPICPSPDTEPSPFSEPLSDAVPEHL